MTELQVQIWNVSDGWGLQDEALAKVVCPNLNSIIVAQYIIDTVRRANATGTKPKYWR